MRVTHYTDYALRVLIYLALNEERRCTIPEVADAYGISRNHLMKVTGGLVTGGFIRTQRGKAGGVMLAKPAREINLGTVVRHMEGPLRPVECFRARENRCVITRACELAGIFAEACDVFLATFDRYTLADLVGQRERLLQALVVH
jgi:Rrf2 family nitric oxide-sensitive transcriptional repressor